MAAPNTAAYSSMKTLSQLQAQLSYLAVSFLMAEERPAHLPVVEDRQREGLALSVCAEVGLKAKGVDGGDEGLDGVERRAWDGCVLGDVAPGRSR